MNKYICHLHLSHLYFLIQICICIEYHFVFVSFYIAMGSPSRATPRLPRKHFSLLFQVLLPDFYSPSDVFLLPSISFVGTFQHLYGFFMLCYAFSLLSAPRLLLAEIFLSFRHFKGAGSDSWCNMRSLHVCLKDHNFINRPLMLVREKGDLL